MENVFGFLACIAVGVAYVVFRSGALGKIVSRFANVAKVNEDTQDASVYIFKPDDVHAKYLEAFKAALGHTPAAFQVECMYGRLSVAEAAIKWATDKAKYDEKV